MARSARAAALAALLVATVALTAGPAAADMWTHTYEIGEEVPVWVNTVGPFKNPTETYSYFEKLPVCHPDVIQHRRETLGEVMEGNRLVEAGYDVHFRGTVACSRGPMVATRSAAALIARTGAIEPLHGCSQRTWTAG